jgi:hypothetical protein
VSDERSVGRPEGCDDLLEVEESEGGVAILEEFEDAEHLDLEELSPVRAISSIEHSHI